MLNKKVFERCLIHAITKINSKETYLSEGIKDISVLLRSISKKYKDGQWLVSVCTMRKVYFANDKKYGDSELTQDVIRWFEVEIGKNSYDIHRNTPTTSEEWAAKEHEAVNRMMVIATDLIKYYENEGDKDGEN